jgi:hypothetical protein
MKDLVPGGGGYIEPKQTGAIPTWAQFQATVTKEATEIETLVNQNASRIYAAASCFHSGSRSLNFCQQFRT